MSSFKFWKELWLKNCVSIRYLACLSKHWVTNFCEPFYFAPRLLILVTCERGHKEDTSRKWNSSELRNVTKRKYPVINIPAFESIPAEKIYFFSIYLEYLTVQYRFYCQTCFLVLIRGRASFYFPTHDNQKCVLRNI